MSLISQGSQPASSQPVPSGLHRHPRFMHTAGISPAWSWRLLFLSFLTAFYLVEILWIKPVYGSSDDWNLYSTLSGAYLGYPEAHVPFFLYPLSWLLSSLYTLCSFIPWYGIFLHGVQIACLYAIYQRSLQIWRRHNSSGSFVKPALALLCILFLIVNLHAFSITQYTTAAGLAAAAALFCFITTRTAVSAGAFLKGNIPAFIFAWISYCMCRDISCLLLPIAGMLWLSKWVNAYRNGYDKTAYKLLGSALILAAGMGLLYGLDAAAYAEQTWKDFRQSSHYREQAADFYAPSKYEEPAAKPQARLNNILTGMITAFFYEDGIQPANVAAFLLIAAALLLTLLRRNYSALFVYLLYLAGRTASWALVLYDGHAPKQIIRTLITVDYMVLLGLLLAFNLLKLESLRRYAVILPVIFLSATVSVIMTKYDIDIHYHAQQETWAEMKTYCQSHPDNLYIWPYDSGTLENYCESPFDLTSDIYHNFIYMDQSTVMDPSARAKLARHGIGDFGRDLIENDSTFFLLQDTPNSDEHPVIMYFRHTCGARAEAADRFMAGGAAYVVYRLQP